MTLAELIADFRLRTGDVTPEYLFSDKQVKSYANLAENEAAIRSKLLYDNSNTAIVMGTSTYALNPLLFKIDSAIVTDALGVKSMITPIDRPTLSKQHPEWQLAPSGRPKFIITDEASIQLFPTPDAAYKLTLYYYRTPKDAMQSSTDEPEILPRHHDGLVDWMIRCALLVKDIDTESLTLSTDYEAKFIRRFGIREDANVMRKQAQKGAHTTKAIRF